MERSDLYLVIEGLKKHQKTFAEGTASYHDIGHMIEYFEKKLEEEEKKFEQESRFWDAYDDLFKTENDKKGRLTSGKSNGSSHVGSNPTLPVKKHKRRGRK